MISSKKYRILYFYVKGFFCLQSNTRILFSFSPHRHILEDVRPGVDPSLCEKQRQLKRAKLADSLSNQLLLRPGPLELIKKNILHTDDPVGKYNLPFKNRTVSILRENVL